MGSVSRTDDNAREETGYGDGEEVRHAMVSGQHPRWSPGGRTAIERGTSDLGAGSDSDEQSGRAKVESGPRWPVGRQVEPDEGDRGADFEDQFNGPNAVLVSSVTASGRFWLRGGIGPIIGAASARRNRREEMSTRRRANQNSVGRARSGLGRLSLATAGGLRAPRAAGACSLVRSRHRACRRLDVQRYDPRRRRGD
jgi:hypothetical protein